MKGDESLLEILEEGRGHFNAGRYFEAHEAWERAWLVQTGETKRWLQGLIQIAAGLLKARSGNRAAAVRLLDAGLGRIDAGAAPRVLAGFADDVRRLTAALRGPAPESPDWPVLPPFASVK